ncbi:polysaccharide lyase family 1 protein [Halosimplex aquaticum]|uniref:Polysaccharide lyase family 1 protein n=1 Tax=Halosimplex aquaticum TaxID=3026162 RepID=A0ABD5Y3I0_9EURY|nr:right-handed parallel beta-helix repeat-containing protein [Halosimplex aquaticum]
MTEERRRDSDSDRTHRPAISRRRLLAIAGLGAAGATAGCNGLGGDATPTPDPDGGNDPADSPASTPTATATPEATETAAETSTATETSTQTSVASGFDADTLAESPSSHVAPADGFADASWLSGALPDVVKVTTLDASGEGSLRWALNQPGARIVVFEVGGVIDLGGQSLAVSRPNVFVAGQTAPSPGITIIRGGLTIGADNVILQHLRVRPGDDLSGPVDCIGNEGGSNVIVDHCTATWGSDESISTNAGAENPKVTLSNNLIAECLNDSIHPKGEHGYGTLVMDRSKQVTIAGNLWANNVARHPRLKGGSTSVVVNNVAYNYERALNLGGGVADETRASVVGNFYAAGERTDPDDPVIGTTYTDADGPVTAFVAYNETDPSSIPITRDGTRIDLVSERPLWPDGLAAVRGEAAYENALSASGARPADRDAIDERIVSDVDARAGGVIDSQEEVGGYPDPEPTERELDVPESGLAEWLREFTLAVEQN